jgi:uncharacterized protein YrzB (UPF0473 family)
MSEHNCNCGSDHEKEHAHKHEHDHDGCCGDGCGHDHGHPQTLTLETDDGEKVECAIIGVFDVEDKEYIALLPENSEDVFLYGFSEKEGDVELTRIETDEEYEQVGKVFMELMEMDAEEDEEDEA